MTEPKRIDADDYGMWVHRYSELGKALDAAAGDRLKERPVKKQLIQLIRDLIAEERAEKSPRAK